MNKILWTLVIFLIIGLQLEYSARESVEDKIYAKIDEITRQDYLQALIIEFPDLFKNVRVQ